MMNNNKSRDLRKRKSLWAWLAGAVLAATGLGVWLWSGGESAEQSYSLLNAPDASEGYTPKSDAAAFAAYGGSASCRECHQEAYDLWKNSHHGLAERPMDLALDRFAFDPHRVFKHGTQTSEARVNEGRFELNTLGFGGEKKAYPLERVIGVNPLLQYLVAAPGGRFQITELAADPRSNDWFNVYGEEDRQPGEWGHWTGRGMNWNMMCATCHNTRLRKNYQGTNDSYATTMAEMSVGCEACHGPMVDHVHWQKLHPTQPGDPTLRKLSWPQWLDTCGSCHARRGELTGDFVPGERFADHFALTFTDDTDIYYPDGQVRDEDYEYASFLSSKMHLAGVRCIDCHEPHAAKIRTDWDSLCMNCHGPPKPPAPKIDPAAHGFHKLDQPGGRCVGCHMPQTVYMARHWRRDHGFTIPDPLLTKQHGIPNACNRCHPDKSVDWSIEYVEKWYGARMERPSRTRAQWIAQARKGDDNAVGPLLTMARAESNALWRATATILLRRWCQATNVTRALIEQTKDTDPLVRAMAVRGLDMLVPRQDPAVLLPLNQLLDDPVRLVRVDAAWALRTTVSTNSTAFADLVRYLRHGADQPGGALQVAVFYLDRGDADTALSYLRKSIVWDPNSAPLHHALAMALNLQGKTDDVVPALQEACRLAPRDPEYRYKLGLALNEIGKLPEATAALEETVKLDPQFSQAWYNLGLAYSASNQTERALEALLRAEAIDSVSARIPYARATVLARLGRLPEARAAARRTLELQPASPEATALLRQLEANR